MLTTVLENKVEEWNINIKKLLNECGEEAEASAESEESVADCKSLPCYSAEQIIIETAPHNGEDVQCPAPALTPPRG